VRIVPARNCLAHGSRSRAALWVACAALLLCWGQSGAISAVSVVVDEHVTAFHPAELQTQLATTPLTASFVSPSGEAVSFASFERQGWRVVRFTLTEPGTWSYTLFSTDREWARGTVEVAPATSHGFVHARGHALAFDDGTPFVAIGENRINLYDPSWNWNSLGIEDYMRYMAENGMTVLRVFVVSDVENEEHGGRNAGVLEPALGRFDDTVARQFDTIFRAAENRGLYVVLVAFALGFSQDDAWKSWHDNPYAQENGGPAASAFDFFESPAARARAAERIRYLAARYASSPNLLAIDLLNEPEWDGGIPETTWTPWAQEMARVWRSVDPFRHPVTVGSVGLHWNIEGDERAWWSSDACDIVQWHLYGKEVYDVHALAAEMTRKVREAWPENKPVLVGEFAYGGEPKPDYDHTHVGLWSATFSGAGVLAHSAPPFNVDSDELMTPERAHHFRVLRDVLQGLPALAPGEVSATAGTSAWALRGSDAAAVWLLAPQKGYGNPVRNVRVTVRGLDTGRWRVRWLNDVTGAPLRESAAVSRGGVLKLAVPAFTKHVAARLERRAHDAH
jgi:hypothetical protein